MPPKRALLVPDTTMNASDGYDFFEPNIVVRVGKPPTAFNINAGILSSSSGYFKAIFSNKKPHSKQPSIELPQYEPAAFNVYLNWIHRGELFIKQPTARKGKGDQWANRESFWDNVLESYFIGRKLEDPDFNDALVDAALLSMLGDHEGVTWFPGRRIRQRLYDNTSPGCCMRRLFVHMAASLTNVKELVQDDDPLAFRSELQDELKNGKEEDTYEIGGACAFHEHKPGKMNCYRAERA